MFKNDAIMPPPVNIKLLLSVLLLLALLCSPNRGRK